MYFLSTFTIPGGLSLSVPKYDASTSWGTSIYTTTAVNLPNGQQFFPYGSGDAPADGTRRVVHPCVIVGDNAALAQVEAEKWQSLSGRVGILSRAPMRGAGFVEAQQCSARLVDVVVPTGTTKQQPFLYITLIFEVQGGWQGRYWNVFGGTTTLLAPNYGTRNANPIVYVTINGSTTGRRVELYNDTPGANVGVRINFTPVGSGLDSLVFNTQTMEVLYNGTNIYSGLSFLSNHKRIEWYPILPGMNALRVYIPGSGLNGWTVRYHDSYY